MCSALWGTATWKSRGVTIVTVPRNCPRARRRSANCSLEITRGTGAQYSWSAGPAASQDADGGTLVLRFLSRPGLLLAPVGGNPGQSAREQTLQVPDEVRVMSFHRAGGGGGTASSSMSSKSNSSKSSKSGAHRRLVHLAHYMCIALRPATMDRQAKSKSKSK